MKKSIVLFLMFQITVSLHGVTMWQNKSDIVIFSGALLFISGLATYLYKMDQKIDESSGLDEIRAWSIEIQSFIKEMQTVNAIALRNHNVCFENYENPRKKHYMRE